jgi:hypothetical protein
MHFAASVLVPVDRWNEVVQQGDKDFRLRKSFGIRTLLN